MMGGCKFNSVMQLLGFLVLFGFLGAPVWAKTHYHTFVIQDTEITRLCHTTTVLTVNGQYPGPTIYARKDDTVIVKVINHGYKNITIHWHGVDQPRNPWSDGPEQITQCAIQPGANFTQTILFTEEEGTIWWHAHSDFDRATVYGAIIVHPKLGTTFPYPEPYKEITLLLGEWWIGNITQILDNAIQTGGDIPPSNASTINGQPGDLLPCSKNDTFKVKVEQGKTYLLRVINGAISNEYFFAIAGHNVTVVGTDASYTKPYLTNRIMITPGQTFDLLLEANQLVNSSSPTRYYIAARPYSGNLNVSFDSTITTAVLEYITNSNTTNSAAPPLLPTFPAFDDTDAATEFTSGLRSLASVDHPVNVPQIVDEQMYITVSVNTVPCGPEGNCTGPRLDRLAASLNNASFRSPMTVDILEAYYYSISDVYTPNFPDQPPFFFNFTEDVPPTLWLTKKSTKVKVLEYNTSLEIVFQGTNTLGGENHPMHIHGQSFYVVGSGFGIFDKEKDPQSYNLIDPPYENTIGVPKNGWTTIRFRAMNPGVWFMHCHFDRHLVWGMDTVFIVKNGNTPDAQILPPPANMPPC